MQKTTLNKYCITLNGNNFTPVLLLLMIFTYVCLGLSRVIPHICLFEYLFNIHCPFCNVTISLDYLFKGEVRNSLISNPLGLLFVTYLIIYQILKLKSNYKLHIYLERVFTILIAISYLTSFYANYI
jgi:hypothetical protein